jgi:two-component system, chemotaxis family, chemotaxis protein CheY
MTLRVLIVDDSRLARKILKDTLTTQSDCEISEVGNGVEALEFCRRNPVDVLFLDLTMPEMDGFEFLERMKSEEMSSFVIVVSADIQPKAQERVIALGAKAFIGKPATTAEISKCLQEQGFL